MTTTITTTVTIGMTAALGVIVTLMLIALLVVKELATGTPGDRVVHWARVLNIGIIPLVMAFVVIAAVKLVEIA